MPDIASRRNAQVRLARSLKRSGARRETGLFLVEGLRHIGELLASPFTTEFILFDPETLTSAFGNELIETAHARGIPVHAATAAIMDGLSERGSSVGPIAAARRTDLPLAPLAPPTDAWCVALVAPRDPGNIGTILRTMDAFDAGPLLLLDGGADPWQPGSVRASMGALFTHPVVECTFADFAAWAGAHELPVYGTSARADADIRQLSAVRPPAALLFGSEREGLSPEQRAACTQVLRIPIHGRGTSLNLAVAAGVALYTTMLNLTLHPASSHGENP